jgi:cell wall-associated NlpC family hydrolase
MFEFPALPSTSEAGQKVLYSRFQITDTVTPHPLESKKIAVKLRAVQKTPVIILCCILLATLSLSEASGPAPGIRRLGYAIQMGAFANVNNAERFTTMLQKKGIEAFYFRKDNGIYAVRFGDFPSRERARAAAARLVADRLISSYYIAPPNEVVFAPPRKPVQPEPSVEGPRQPRETPRSEQAEVPEAKPRQQTKQVRGDRDMGVIAARTAERFVGIPYRWGGNTVVDGMDCSGFVRAVYNLCGVSIPRTSREQFKAGELVTKVDLQDGDLVFFGAADDQINHVGIYVGNGKFVHAPRRGEEIRITPIDEAYFEKRFVGARRYF